MKSVKRSIVKSAILAMFAMTLIYSGPAWADCYSEQERILTFIQSLNPDMSTCEMARTIKYNYPQILQFYNKCQIVDPTGEMRDFVRRMLTWADQVEASVCEY